MKKEDNPKEASKDISKPRDISKKTIAILLVLAIIVSVASTLIVMGSTPKVKIIEDTGSAQVSVIVAPPPVKEGARVSVNVAEGE